METIMVLRTKPSNILPKIDLAQLCRDLRKRLGLTQEEMGELLGATGRNYRRWETGEFEPHGQAAAKLLWIRDNFDQVRLDLQELGKAN